MRCLIRAVSVFFLCAAVARASFAHGGVYIGPGTSVPPAGSVPAGPQGPAAGTPPGPMGPGGPAPASGPGTGQMPGLGPSTGSPAGQDPGAWQAWWWFNRAPYLNLKVALARHVLATGNDGGGSELSSQRSEVSRLRQRMTAVLSRELGSSNAPDLVTAILLALGKAGSCAPDAEISGLMDAIKPSLRDANQEISETAAIALGALAHPSPALLLAEILEDSPAGRAALGRPEVPYRTRAFAAYGLGLVGQRAHSPDVRLYIVRHLVRAFESDRTGTNDLAVACIEALGLVHVETLAAGIEKQASANPPGVSGESEGAHLLQWFVGRRNADVVRAYVPVSLVRSLHASTPEFIEPVLAALCPVLDPHAKETPLVQQSTVMALGALPTSGDIEPKRILSALQDSSSHGDKLASNLALVSLARVSAADSLASTGVDNTSQVRALLIREIARGPTIARGWAALALGLQEYTRMKSGGGASNEAHAAIQAALLDRRSPSEVGAYCIAAGLMHDSSAHEALLRILVEGQEDDLRAHAAIGLGMMQDDSAIEPLRKVLADSRYRPVLLRDSAIALGLLGDPRAAPLLWTMLAESKSLGAQSAIASALGFIGDARSIEPLMGLIENKASSDRTKAFAAAALGNICDESTLPWNCSYALDVNYVMAPATLYEPAGGTGILDLL
jgi:HEAT repeat protein